MILRSLRLRNFRAHRETQVSFAPGVNLLYGPNGAGKTNILEAIHYLCLTKSFLTSQDGYVLQKGAPFFEVEGHLQGERRAELKARLVYMPDEGKRVFLNGTPLERLADLIGVVPVVAFSPGDHVLTAGGPEERRRFLNNILSQSRPVYLTDLFDYRRVLQQRNELLAQYRRKRTAAPRALLEPWDVELVEVGSRIVAGRARFVAAFAAFLEQAYAEIEAVAERPSIRYVTFAPLEAGDDEAAIAERFRTHLRQAARREQERGQTLLGPHRDDLVFYLNAFEVRRYASQGQHRTFGMALKLAQYLYLQDQTAEPPLLLLDDIFDHLDERRTAAFIQLIQGDLVRQSILTATEKTGFRTMIPFGDPRNRAIRVEVGRVAEEEAEM